MGGKAGSENAIVDPLLRHNLIHIVLQVNLSKTQPLIILTEKKILTGIHAKRHPRVVRGAMHSGKSDAVHSG